MSPPPPPPRRLALASLRAQVAQLERGATTRPAVSLCPAIDRTLPDGGLLRGAVHEVLAGDEGAAAGFCALVLGRLGGTVAWIAAEPDGAPQGLIRFGLQPANILFVAAPEPADAFWAMEEALRCSALAGALLLASPASLTVARRLQLAAEVGGGLGLLLRPDDGADHPTTALTRWRVASRAEMPVVTPALGWRPSWQLDLLRARGGREGRWHVSWNDDASCLVVEGDGQVSTGQASTGQAVAQQPGMKRPGVRQA